MKKGTGKTIRVEEDGYTWNIEGKDIENVPEKNISLKVTSNPETFPTQNVDDFFGDTIASRFSLEHDGEFGFKATLHYLVGTQYLTKYANLFYVAGDGTFEFIESAVVDENGYADLTFTHASDYIVAITDTEYAGQELNPKIEDTAEPEIASELPQESTSAMEASEIEADSQVQADDSVEKESSSLASTTEKTVSNPIIWIASIVVVLTIIASIVLIMKKRK